MALLFIKGKERDWLEGKSGIFKHVGKEAKEIKLQSGLSLKSTHI